jgi:hypothetical protein
MASEGSHEIVVLRDHVPKIARGLCEIEIDLRHCVFPPGRMTAVAGCFLKPPGSIA